MENITKEEILDQETIDLLEQIKLNNTDLDIFFKYWIEKTEGVSTCMMSTIDDQIKAEKLGFNFKSRTGSILVSLVDYYVENEELKNAAKQIGKFGATEEESKTHIKIMKSDD